MYTWRELVRLKWASRLARGQHRRGEVREVVLNKAPSPIHNNADELFNVAERREH